MYTEEEAIEAVEAFDLEHMEGSLQKLFLGNFCGYEVYSVNGNFVKRLPSPRAIEWTEAGHFLRYEFIPENEIWIDNNLNNLNYAPNLLHETWEIINWLKYNLDYETAHTQYAMPIEAKYRLKEFEQRYADVK